MKSTLFLIALFSQTGWTGEITYADYDFNQKNTIQTNVLEISAEPMEPNTSQKGPLWVAKGKPFYFKNSDQATGWTVAPGTQYQIGIESSCKEVEKTGECLRDNALAIEVYGDAQTKENGGIQDKAMFQLHEVSATDPNYVIPNGQTPVHLLSFDMKFDKYYEVSKSQTMHLQSFQPGCGPAMSMKVEKWIRKGSAVDYPINLYFELMRDKKDAPDDASETLKVCPGITVNRGEWNNLYFKMAPGNGINKSGRTLGRFFVYLNNKKVCEFSDNWGMIDRFGVSCNQGHRIDLGVYSGRTVERRKVYFDNIIYTSAKEQSFVRKSRVNLP